MAINKKLIYIETKDLFNKLIANLADTSIVFIKDTGELWTHGKLFAGNFSSVDNNKISLTLGGQTIELSKFGHTHPYLPLTGGTLTGNLTISSNDMYITYSSYGISIKENRNLLLGQYTPQHIYLQTPGNIYYSPKSGTDYKIWHENNDGSGSGLDADMLDGLHGYEFLKLVNSRFIQHQQGVYTKILEFTINEGDYASSISFIWHPTECVREIWADFNINIRLNSILFFANWKGTITRDMYCVGNGTTFSVWVKGEKDGYDPYGIIQVINKFDVISYNAGALAYQDTEPTDLYTAKAVLTGLSYNATRADTATISSSSLVLNNNARMDYGWDGINYFNINGSAGNGAKVNDTPTSAWWHILRFNHGNPDGYYTDLAVPFTDNSLYYKTIRGGVVLNNGWVLIWDATNFNPKDLLPTNLFINTGDATLKFYSGKTIDAQNDGNICLLTSIDETDGETHEYPIDLSYRCNLVLLPRGGQVYIGNNPSTGDINYKLNVNGKIYSTGGYVKEGSSDSYVLLGGGGHIGTWEFASSNIMRYKDSRDINYNPYDGSLSPLGLSSTHLKYNNVDGLSDGGTYHTSIYLHPWYDTTGGFAHNLAFTDNGNIWLRSGNNEWNDWKKLAFTTDNVASATRLLNSITLWGLNFTGQYSVSGDLHNVGDIIPISSLTKTIGDDLHVLKSVYTRRVSAPDDYGISIGNYDREQINITASNKVGINTFSPLYTLDVNGDTRITRSIVVGNNNLFIRGWSTNDNNLHPDRSLIWINYIPELANHSYRYVLGWNDSIKSARYSTGYAIGTERENNEFGNMYFSVLKFRDVGNTEALATMALLGKNNTLWISGNLIQNSDIRLQSNILPLINRGFVTPIKYTMGEQCSLGFSAQEMKSKYPELVIEGSSKQKYLSVNYSGYTAVLQAQIIELNNKLKQLLLKFDALREKINI